MYFCLPQRSSTRTCLSVKNMEQHDLFSEIEPPRFTIRQSAILLSVCPATVRNWIKIKYLTQDQNGRITRASLARFQSKRSFKAQISPKGPNLKLKHYPQIWFSIPSASVLQPGKPDAIRRAATHRPSRCTG